RGRRAAWTSRLHWRAEMPGTACRRSRGQERDRRETPASDTSLRGYRRTAPKYASAPGRANPCRRSGGRSVPRAPRAPWSGPWPYGSSHDREQPAPTHREWPAPELPGALAFIDREEDDLGTADDVLERHGADLREAAVGRVVAVVAHHEEFA